MKCKNCIASRSDGDYYSPSYWCAVGEKEEIEFKDGSIGCRRKSIEKLKKDIKDTSELEEQLFLDECEKFIEFMEEKEKENEIQKETSSD